jgi:hypothetical protein
VAEPNSVPLPPTAPQKTNPWIIVIAVIVVICLLFVGLAGLLIAFGEPLLHELGMKATLPILFSLR